MTARRKTVGSLLLALVGALAGCTSYFEIPIETPISPKLDIDCVPARARRRLHRGRQRRSRRQSRDGAAAAQPAAAEGQPARHRRRGVAAGRDRRAADAGRRANGNGRAGVADRRPRPARRIRSCRRSRTKRISSRTRRCSPTSSTGRRSARSIRTRSSSPARCSSAASARRLRAARAGSLRLVRPPPRRPGADLHGAQGLHPAPDVRVHRRPDRRDAAQRNVPRGDSLQPEHADAGAVVVLRADGSAAADVPQHVERAEDPRARASC